MANKKAFLRLLPGAALCFAFASGAQAAECLPLDTAPFITTVYASRYAISDLCNAGDIPANYGGLTFALGDPNTLLIGGSANTRDAKIYSVPVLRDTNQHIVGFGPSATPVATANGTGNGGIDGGLAYAPNGVLFYTAFFDNQIGQIKPGSSGPDKRVTLTGMGVARSVGGLAFFVPAGTPPVVHLKLTSFAGRWYDTVISLDANNTYNISRTSSPSILIGDGPEGIVYVPPGSPLFPKPSVLIVQSGGNSVTAYEIDPKNGDPILSTAETFIDGLFGAEGAAIDPVTGDFLFTSFSSNRVFRVNVVPEPGTWMLLALGLSIVSPVAYLRRPDRQRLRLRGADCRARSLTSCSGSGSAV
jgi:hypothetical protein